MRVIKVETPIEATAEEVWAVLTDTPSYPSWNPFVRHVEGDLEVGERIAVRIEPEDWNGMDMTPKLLVVDAPRELRWVGHLWVKGIFDGEHSFTIETDGPGRVRLVHAERFSGALVFLMRRKLTQDGGLARSFAAMNRAVAEQVRARRSQVA